MQLLRQNLFPRLAPSFLLPYTLITSTVVSALDAPGQAVATYFVKNHPDVIRAEAEFLDVQTEAEALRAQADALFIQGIRQAQSNQLREAVQFWNRALQLYQDPTVQSVFPQESRQQEEDTIYNLALAYMYLEEYEQAIDVYQQYLPIIRELGDRRLESDALGNLGLASLNLGHYEQSIEFSEQALAISRELDNQQGQQASLNNLGLVYNSVEEYEQSIEFFGQALVISRELGDRQEEVNVLFNLGLAYENSEQYRQAINLYGESLVIARDIGDRQGEANALVNIGVIHNLLEQYERAIEFHQQAWTVTRELGDRQGEINALGNLGEAYRRQARYQQAISFYEQSLHLAREIGDRRGELITLGSLGLTYLNLGRYQQAISFLNASLAIARETGNRQEEGSALTNLGLVYESLGQYPQATTFYEEGLAVAREIDNRQGEGSALGNLGFYYNVLEQPLQAIYILEESLSILRDVGDRQGEGDVLINLGSTYSSLEQYEQAIELYEQSLAVWEEIGNRRGEAHVLSNLGEVYNNLGQREQAIEFYERSIVIAREIGDRQREGIAHSNLGNAYKNLGQYGQASNMLFTAIEIYESLRSEEISDAQRISLFDAQGHAYFNLQRALVAQNEIEQALEISERGRARAFASSLAKRQNSETPSIQPPSISEIQYTAQKQNSILVQYSYLSATDDDYPQLYVWVIQPTGEITFRSVDLSGLDNDLFNIITSSRDAIGVRRRNNDATFEITLTPEALRRQTERQRQTLQELHTLLINPIADLLPTDPNAPVIIIPHQELFLVPFPALVDANGDYLIQKHTLLTAPSIQVLQLLGEQQTTTATGDPLIIGNPIMPSIWNPATGQDEPLSSLPGAEAEAVAIAQALNTEPLLWESASETAVTQQMPTASILHFATHGLLDYGDPTATGVRDFPGAIALAAGNGEDGLLTAAEIYDLNLSAELVVLSACDTGRGRITGDGVIGLSRSFIQAGVPQVMVSLWAVPDAPTAQLMTTFYEQRALTDSDAQALRQAMLIMLEDYPNPRDWAAFTLIGGTQQK